MPKQRATWTKIANSEMAAAVHQRAQIEEQWTSDVGNLTHIAYRDSVIRDLERKYRDLEGKLQIEKDVSWRSHSWLVAQIVEEGQAHCSIT